MIISIGLAKRFQQINIRLRDICQKVYLLNLYRAAHQIIAILVFVSYKFYPKSTWYEIRNHYVLWCELLEQVDKFMAPLILLSCANNLYFICFQLMNIFE